MKNFSIREFKPTILFLVKFIGLYVVINLLYGFYVSAYLPGPDPATSEVSDQTSIILNACGWSTSTVDSLTKPITLLSEKSRTVLAIYEGCNGINVMIIFVAFLFAFGPVGRQLLWFIPAGLVILHLANLLRVAVLFWVSMYQPDFMYFLHKYLFTAFLYVIVFALWIFWVRRFSKVRAAES